MRSAAHDVVRALLSHKATATSVLCIGTALIASAIAPLPAGAGTGTQNTAQQQQAAKAAAEAAAKAAAKAAAEAAARAAAKRAAQQAAAKAAAEAAAKAAAQAAAKAAQQAAAKAAQQAAAKAAAEAAARAAAQQQAAAKAAADRQRQQQQQQQQAAAKAAADRQRQQQQQQPGAKAEADRQRQQQQQQPGAKAEADRQRQQQQQQQAATKAEADRQKQQQQQQAAAKAAAERQKQQQQQQAAAKAEADRQKQQQQQAEAEAERRRQQDQAEADAARQREQAQAADGTDADQQDGPDGNNAAAAKPLPDVKTQQAQIEKLLRHSERAAVERREQRRLLEELRRREAQQSEQQGVAPQLGESPATAASAQTQQSAQIEEIRQQLLRAELGRAEERKKLEELKRRQQMIEAEMAQPRAEPPAAQPPAAQQSAGQPQPVLAPSASQQLDTERLRQQAEIAEMQRKQENWDARRIARMKRIEELIELRKTRAVGAEQQSAGADQGRPAFAPSAQQLEIMQQQARRMALGHPAEKPSAPPQQLELVKADPIQLPTQSEPQAATKPAGGAISNPGEGEPAKTGEVKTGVTPAPGEQAPSQHEGSPATETPAHGDDTSEDGKAHDATTKEATVPPAASPGVKGPAVSVPPDKANPWRPQIVTDDDRNGPFGGKRDKQGWHPEVVAAVPRSEGPPNTGGAVKPAPVGGTPASQNPQNEAGTGTPSEPSDGEPGKAAPDKAEGAPAAPAPDNKAGDKKADQKAEPAKTPKNDRRRPSRDARPEIPNIPVPQAEILATNFGPAEFKKARELGLEPVEPTHLRNLGMKLTRLKVPKGANVASLRKKLAEQMPLGSFADNQRYWIFGAARGGEKRAMLTRPPDLPKSAANAPAAPSGYNSSATGDAIGTDSSASAPPTTEAAATAAPDSGDTSAATADATTASSSESSTAESSAADSSTAENSAGTPEETADDEAAATDADTAQTASNENEVAARSDDNGPASRAPVQQPEMCKGDRCFASKLIKWHNDLQSCTKDVKVGIIDTSFDISHPTFRRMKGSSGQFLNGEAPSTHDWHGTAVLSLLAGDPVSSTPGLIPDASFYLATAFKTDEAGNASTDTMRLLQALDWLDALDVRFINMSFSGPRDPLFEQAIGRMVAKGTVFVAAAGNQGPTAPPSYPAAYPQVIAVTAVNKNAENYRHANRGQYVDLSAPGVEIMTALPDGKQGYRTGTSFAAPFVTAIVATRSDPSLAMADKRELLGRLNMQDLGPPGPDPIYGKGLALAPRNCSGSGGTVAHQLGPAPQPKFSLGSAAGIP